MIVIKFATNLPKYNRKYATLAVIMLFPKRREMNV